MLVLKVFKKKDEKKKIFFDFSKKLLKLKKKFLSPVLCRLT
jgi:hypothetical protein